MFKCVECGTVYRTKPDYCDCGNDIFELFDEVEENTNQTFSQEQELNQAPKNSFYSNEKYYEQPIIKSAFDPISITIFLVCILLSVLTVFFIGNPKETPQAQTQNTTQQASKNIPSVDSYWDNSTTGVVSDNQQNSVKTTEIVVNTAPQVQQVAQTQPTQTTKQQNVDPVTEKFNQWLNQPPKYEQQTQKVVKTNNTTTQPKTPQPTTTTAKQSTNTQQAKKQTQQNNSQADLLARIQKQYSNTKSGTQQTITTTKAQTSTPIKTTQTTNNSKPKDSLANYQLNESAKKTASTINTQTQSAVSGKVTTQTITQQQTAKSTPQQKTVVQQGKSQAVLNQELLTYKASLRNTIGKKINFANVVGDGSCSITFTINSSGKLTNRKFSQQSSNITLNDAVYNAMLATPSYNPPPEGYKNETLTFYVKLYNGNFEITLR